MRKVHLILCVFIFGHFRAQTRQESSLKDSLQKVIDGKAHDTIRARAHLQLADMIKYHLPVKADTLCRQALRLFDKKSQIREIATTYKTLGVLQDCYGDSRESINMYLKAIKYYNLCRDTMGVARTECNIGMLYREIGQAGEAMPYLRQALPIFTRNNFIMGVNLVNQNIGIIFFDQRNADSALFYFDRSQQILEKYGQKDPSLFGNMANVYQLKKDRVNREKYMKKCIEAFEQRNDNSGKYYFWLHLYGMVLLDKGENKKALELVEKAVKGYDQTKMIKSRQGLTMLINLTLLYEKAGRYNEANKVLRRAYNLVEKLNSEDVVASMTEQKERYETDKKELSISNLEKEKKLKEKEIEHQSTQKYALIGVLSLSLLSLVLVYRGLKRQKKDHLIIQHQKELVDQKNKEVKDSIIYAKRLQEAILPSMSLINTYFPHSFVLYKPKDIVAGDFFWMETVQFNEEGQSQYSYGASQVGHVFRAKTIRILIAVADCTGHGVPGAMVSVICSTALNRAVKEFGRTEPGEILDTTRELVIETFNKSGSNVRDGMDISLLSIELPFSLIIEGELTVKWAGANNPLWYTSSGEMKVIAPNKQPIGKSDSYRPFNTHSIKLTKGEQLYLFSDGYADQFGGPKGKKFKYRQLQDLLMKYHVMDMEQQRQVLEAEYDTWKGKLEQVDDVCLIGIKI